MSVHINTKKENIAKTVIMPGDPLRVKYIAEKYLTNPVLVNKTRLSLIYTGLYKDKLVTIATSGMGMPSMGIYAYELFNDFDVDRIIRLGSCGSYYDEIKVRDLILVEKAFTLSNFAYQYDKSNTDIVSSSKSLNKKIIAKALDKDIDLRIGNINTSDLFYNKHESPKIKENFCLGVEMETFALFFIADKLNKEAASVLTVSDNLVSKEILSSEDRERTFDEAITLVLDSIL